jgi:hypothetical protein
MTNYAAIDTRRGPLWERFAIEYASTGCPAPVLARPEEGTDQCMADLDARHFKWLVPRVPIPGAAWEFGAGMDRQGGIQPAR